MQITFNLNDEKARKEVMELIARFCSDAEEPKASVWTSQLPPAAPKPKYSRRPSRKANSFARWTNDDCQFLRENAGKGAKTLARLMHRTEGAIYQQASIMGVSLQKLPHGRKP